MFPDIDLSIPGWTLEYDLLCLAWWAKSVPSGGHAVEIGSFCGRSTSVLLKNQGPNNKVSIVDTFQAIPIVFNNPAASYAKTLIGDTAAFWNLPITDKSASWINAFQHFIGNPLNLEINFKDSKYFVPSNNVNIAFIDGDHQGEKPLEDIGLFLNNTNTLIIVDDYDIKSHPDVVNAVDKIRPIRSVYCPSGGRFAYILPASGPMIVKMIRFIDLTKRFDNSEKLREAFKNSDWQPR